MKFDGYRALAFKVEEHLKNEGVRLTTSRSSSRARRVSDLCNLEDGVFPGLGAGQDVVYALEKRPSKAGCNRPR